jgi:indole-3-glycerol phosphate synthase
MTETYLDKIVPKVRLRLEERKAQVPLIALQRALPSVNPPSFRSAIAAPGVSLIAEVKRASPSKGPIRPDLEVVSLVQSYERAGARAVSVLTEEDFFKGSLDDLREAAAVTSLPVLRKDFLVDEYQIYEARVAGASAVLLIAALLSDAELSRLTACAAGLGLDVLLEVHDAAELERALCNEHAVLGVNNRDLRTFEVTLNTTIELAKLVPPGRLLVGESGIRTHDEVSMLEANGVDGVLVGETLLRCPDAETAILELMGYDGRDLDLRSTQQGEDR